MCVCRISYDRIALTLCAAGEQAAPQVSKAQKRWQAREQEEAERERRIAEEQAQAGDSERALEERSLAQLLQPLGLAVRDIPVSTLTSLYTLDQTCQPSKI